ncbi:hypothetical protein [Corallococcus exercitus]|uniref:Uncharacterized protein n=1 Tax=Corallococcus exercitus TaxID=2316736 RepID=A0A7Y4JNI2_9BACT|nr:hypothetical protein [Corallococcus exercitus]NOK08039.1 hypothetical protein [Corallococcus exercitus]
MQLTGRCLLAACLAFVVSCGTQDVLLGREGLTIVKSEQTAFEALYSTESLQLVVRSELSKGRIVSVVEDSRGFALTTFESPVVDGMPTGSIRSHVESAAVASFDGLQAFSREPSRIAELMGAYRGMAESLSRQMPLESQRTIRDSVLVHATVLSTAMLHLDPNALRQAMPPGRLPLQALHSGEEEDECSGCGPNDDDDDYFSAPVYENVYYEDAPGAVSGEVDAQRMQAYGRGCHGACGPGCDWCVMTYRGVYNCYTNSFCQWHDDHCGAWEHFFHCSIN